MKTYEYDGKRYRSHSKDTLARRLAKGKRINKWGEKVWRGITSIKNKIRKIPKGTT